MEWVRDSPQDVQQNHQNTNSGSTTFPGLSPATNAAINELLADLEPEEREYAEGYAMDLLIKGNHRGDEGTLVAHEIAREQAILETRQNRHLTDLGNAKRLVDHFGDRLRYVGEWGWLVWDGRRWDRDGTGSVDRFAQETVRAIYGEACKEEDAARRKALSTHAQRSESRRALEAMVHIAASDARVVACPDDFDRDPWLLNVTNGTLDLRTGELREHRPSDRITKLAPVSFHPEATCPRWEQFVDEVTGGNVELGEYLRRCVGYSLTGVVREHALPLLYGTGRNGKTTFLETIEKMLGDYAHAAGSDLLLGRRDETDPRSGVAQLRGRRFAKAIETGEGRRLNEALVKKLTGGDTLRGSVLYHDSFEFTPTHKLWLGVNHEPDIRGCDPGIWSRVKKIPFTVCFEGREEKGLADKLLEELSGILSWALRGCREWQEVGLDDPPTVKVATAEYRAGSDRLAAFFEDELAFGQGLEVTAKALRAHYVEWCDKNGERPLLPRVVGPRLRDEGCTERKTNGARYWCGVALRSEVAVARPIVSERPDPDMCQVCRGKEFWFNAGARICSRCHPSPEDSHGEAWEPHDVEPVSASTDDLPF